MTGIYIHIPFCKTRCYYCDFYSNTAVDDDVVLAYFDAVCKEAQHYHGDFVCDTIYIGGGTPSFTDAKYIAKLLRHLKQTYSIASNVEITIETNPDSITPEKLEIWHTSGVNRVSLGVQAVQDKLLKTVGRGHTFEQSKLALKHAQRAGFNNISCDAICGLPGQSIANWQETLDFIAQFEHASCYALELHPGTRLSQEHYIPDEEITAEMLDMAAVYLPQKGLQRYEISNYGRPGLISRHNSKYWTREPYIGLGAGASGFINGTLRYTNYADITKYISAINTCGHAMEATANLTEKDHLYETIMLGLRTAQGIDLSLLQDTQYYTKLVSGGFCQPSSTKLALTDRGMAVSNTVITKILSELGL